MSSITKLILLTILINSLMACEKDSPGDSHEKSELNNGILILNEGLYQNNNSSLSFYNLLSEEVENDFFIGLNEQGLGDVGNDIERYGGKIYIVMNNSHTVHVLSAFSGDLISTISMVNGSVGRSPRSIEFYQNKAYVCSFDGSLVQIDTGSLMIENEIQLGRNPDGIARVGQKLYVTNSGGLDYPNYDSTISVIDIPSFEEIKRISCGINPGAIVADGQGDLYFIRRGNYGTIPSRLFKIDSSIDSVVSELENVDVNLVHYANDKLYLGYEDHSGGFPIIGLYNSLTEIIENPSFIDLSQMNTLYGIDVDILNQRIYLMEANNYSSSGDVLIYDIDGNYLKKFGVGYLPSKMIVFN